MRQIIVSKSNIASANIGKILSKQYGLKFTETELGVLALESVINLDAELIIVASSHKSVDGRPTLTCHTTGNWGEAKLGGKDKTLSIAPALYLREALLELKKQKEVLKLDEFEVSMECTHHSPSMDLPIIFVEVGSTKKEWDNMVACSAVANVIAKIVMHRPSNVPIAIGIGGTHYCGIFTKVIFRTKTAIGHVCPKYHCASLDEHMLRQAIEKTVPKPDFALLDWKGLGGHKRRIIELLKSIGIDYRRAQALLK